MTRKLIHEAESVLMLDAGWIPGKAAAAWLITCWVGIPAALQALTAICFLDLVLSAFDPKRALWETIKKDAVAVILCTGVQVITIITRGQGVSPLYLEAASFIPVFYSVIIGIHVLKSVSSVGLPVPDKVLAAASKFEALTGAEKREIQALELKQDQEVVALDLVQAQRKADSAAIGK